MQLHREREAIRARGGRLVLVGNGNRRQAAAFKEELGLSVPLYVDTRREAYRALDLKRGVLRLLIPATLSRLVRAWRTGARQKGIQGDPWQMGGVLVVHPGGRVSFEKRSDGPGDHPPVADVLQGLAPTD